MTNQVEFIEDKEYENEPIVDDSVTSVLSGEVDVAPETVVNMTQVVRSGILRKITDHGRQLPTDEDGVRLALTVLKDMDHTALTTSKLNIEEKKANSASQVAAIADSILAKMSLGTSPGEKRDLEKDIELPDINLLDGEIDQGERSLNPDEWLADRE